MKNTSSPTRIYEANHLLTIGIRIWPEMFAEFIEHHSLLWRFILRDISARYKQSFLGIFWAALTPLTMTAVFVWIRNKGILPIAETAMPYTAFVFLGQMLWLFFASSLLGTSNSLVSAGSMLTKINFPREILVLSAIGQPFFELLTRIPLLLVVFLWTGFTPHPAILFVPLLLVPLFFLVAGIGFFVAFMNALMRDVGNALGIILNLGMFATPVIYPPPESGILGFVINVVNPVSAYITAARDLATYGHIIAPSHCLISLVVSITIFLAGWRIFHLVEPIIAERA